MGELVKAGIIAMMNLNNAIHCLYNSSCVRLIEKRRLRFEQISCKTSKENVSLNMIKQDKQLSSGVRLIGPHD